MATAFKLRDYVYAHRGLWNKTDAPENSIAAYQRAIDAGIAMEFDIRLSRDGVPVCFHDRTLDKMTGVDGALADYSAEDLTRLTLKDTPQTIPTLETVLAKWPHKAPLIVEIKAMDIPPVPIAKAVAAQMTSYAGHAAVISFNKEAVATLPDSLMRGLLIEKIHKSSQAEFDASLEDALALKVDFLSIWRDDLARAAPFARAHGLAMVAWTIEDIAQSKAAVPFVDAQIFEGFSPALVSRA